MTWHDNGMTVTGTVQLNFALFSRHCALLS